MQVENAMQAKNISPILRTALENVYLDWLNNYVSVDTYAEHNQLTYKQAFDLITLAHEVFHCDPPDAWF